MKKSIIGICILFITLLMASCGGSTKGKWTDDDKKAFRDECTGVKEVKDMGETGIKLCDCMLGKSEADFNSFKDADSDESKMTTFGEACAVEVMAGSETPADTLAPADSTVQAE
jgi:uncharacterized protein with GYD domain